MTVRAEAAALLLDLRGLSHTCKAQKGRLPSRLAPRGPSGFSLSIAWIPWESGGPSYKYSGDRLRPAFRHFILFH